MAWLLDLNPQETELKKTLQAAGYDTRPETYMIFIHCNDKKQTVPVKLISGRKTHKVSSSDFLNGY